MGAIGSLFSWTKGDKVRGRSCFPSGLVGKIIPTRGPLAHTITYCIFPHVTVYLDRSDLLSRELMYDTLYPSKRAGGLRGGTLGTAYF